MQDDEDKTTITAGSLVTVFVKLTRRSLGEVTNATVSFTEEEKNEIMMNDEGRDENDEEKEENPINEV